MIDMENYAVVEDGKVTNIVVWDGKSEWAPYNGDVIPAPDGIGIGWLYADGSFTTPALPENVKTQEDIDAEKIAGANSEYIIASEHITALNEQIEDADYTVMDEELVRSLLAEWIEYRKKIRAFIAAGDGSKDLPRPPSN